MLLVLTEQLKFGSLDDACTKEQVLHRDCSRVHTVSSRKYAPPPFCTLLLGKSGEGAFARIFSSSRALHHLSPFLVVLSTHVQIRQLRRLPRSFAECVTTGNQRHLC